ncbi:MAG: TonB-dependent receptor, partial [Gammaproteobacteria bacterium]|nr:TonB-dependent receptor [Gammaproteobacteria bacterium]
DVGYTDRYYLHSLSLTWRSPTGDMVVRGGSRNLFDEEPPLVDGTEIFSTYGRPYGGFGYDLLGRTFFLNFTYSFGQL